jgi:nucleotide-binding universal stress UspA family protein
VPDPEVQVERRLEQGDAATEIVRVAQETHCDLIVIGTHGRTGLSRVLMGSVAEKVLRQAPCPVLAVKTPFENEAPITTPPAPASAGTAAQAQTAAEAR